MDEDPRIKDIFLRARELASTREREAYLNEICAGDGELREQVESLLRSEDEAGTFLQLTEREHAGSVLGEGPGTVVGRYKLLEEIGRGGFGVVYMAEQLEPVRRKVALKVIKAGMDTREVIARFEAERQALALMDHPNIARVLDAGATEAGRPYFVMELVRGLPVTEFCDRESLSYRERLEIFVAICHAVQHAHQKGVIHRDLKPSNVLVSVHDGRPVPKVIDFGVAKALGQSLTERTLFTGFHDMIGTPAYMSPEQAQLSGQDVDTRSDVYSLGILLYELLVGTTPFDRDTLGKAALDEIRRMIRETDPPTPSQRLRTLGGKLPEIARFRATDAATLARTVRGELDWIVMKALEKDRRRRYETSDALAQDVGRYLNDQPVVAAAPGAGYVMRKFVRRHRVGIVTAGAFLTLLVAGTVVSTWQAIRASRAEQAQRVLRERADEARDVETRLRRLADARQRIARASLLVREGDLEAADTLVGSIDSLMVDLDPVEAGEIHTAIGAWRARNAEWSRAATSFGRVIEADPGSFDARHRLAPVYVQVGDSLRYDALRTEMLDRFGDTHDPFVAASLVKDCLIRPWTPAAMDTLAHLADTVLDREPDVRQRRRLLLARGLLDYRRGRFTAAEAALREVAEGGEWERNLDEDVQAYMLLAMSRLKLGRASEARATLVNGLGIARDALPADETALVGWRDWNEWILSTALMDEATRLVEGSTSSSAVTDSPPASGRSPEPAAGHADRAALMLSRGVEASLTIFPARLGGQAFGRVSGVIGTLLEQMGLRHIALEETVFDPGPETGMPHVIEAFGRFVVEHPIASEYALYAEYNGTRETGVVELRAVVVDRDGNLVWQDRLGREDAAFSEIPGPDPMSVTVLLVERLCPSFGLSEETQRAAAPGEMARRSRESSGLPPDDELALLDARREALRRAGGDATLAVYSPRVQGAADAGEAARLARQIADRGLCRASAVATPLSIEASQKGPNELRILWDLARAFREHVRAHPPDADYALYADFVFDPGRWEQGYVHFVVCDRSGEWVVVDLQNSEHADYQKVKPTSEDACSRLLVERLRQVLL